MNDLNYVILISDRCNDKRICDINMLKKYIERNHNLNTEPIPTLINIIKNTERQ